MVTRVSFFIAVCFCVVTHSVSSEIYYTGKEDVSLIDTYETRNCFISYVMINGYKYLIKQKKEYKKQLAVVRDALAAYIAQDLAIAHRVSIIPIKKNFPGKIKMNWPATIHTIASGETVRKQRDSKYFALRLKQHWSHPDPDNEIGLTKKIIQYMTWHKQLPIIVALDLIIGNSDRHCGNLCYDPETDNFCAIDMDDTFNKDLCALACKNFDLMIQGKQTVFTAQEIHALKQMRTALSLLVRKYKPYDLIVQLRSLAHKAGFIKGSLLYDDKVKKKLIAYEQMITSTHESARKLITILNKIIGGK